jgi:hypothetical protein
MSGHDCVWAGRYLMAHVLQSDVLNQVQMELRRSPKACADLRTILLDIGASPTYGAWVSEAQFHGTTFSHAADLPFTHDQDRKYLLHRLALADYLELLVKITVASDRVFITDGLWVPAEYRVFPFADESDRLMNHCSSVGWSDWATCIIDPAMGCGHSLLRYPGSARRYGFDINTRALSYAAVNAAVNDVGVSLLGVNDVRNGLPPMFGQSDAERVLVIANMPFALAPEPESLPRSAEGGRYGYELTYNALEAVSQLERSLAHQSRLRALVLAYSVGSVSDNRWLVHRHAEELFGPERVKWHLLAEEKLWRINGRKQQPNPMPLASLELKADCQFYVRDPARREAVREGYRVLERELAENGCDHLAYGILEISD